MLIHCFDLASRTGIAIGRAGRTPRLIAAQIRKSTAESHPDSAGRLGVFLDELWQVEAPDVVVVEDYMHHGQGSANAAIIAMLFRGCLQGQAARRGIEVRSVSAQTWRKHFCGQANAGSREQTNRMVWMRACQLGYMERAAQPDYDKASAAGLFSWASATIAGKSADAFRLFGPI